jgi:hypothetical protein
MSPDQERPESPPIDRDQADGQPGPNSVEEVLGDDDDLRMTVPFLGEDAHMPTLFEQPDDTDDGEAGDEPRDAVDEIEESPERTGDVVPDEEHPQG